MTDFLAFSKNPRKYHQFSEWKNIFFLQFIILMFIIGSFTLIPPFILTKFLGIKDNIYNLTFREKIIQGIIIAPIAEELIFRLILKEKKQYFYILISVSMVYLIIGIIQNNLNSSILMMIIIAIGITVFGIHYYKGINLYSENNYKLLYWGSILFFGLAHGINFSFSNSWYLLFIPLLILPQILAGFILNYIRVKYGIKYSIEFHLLINLQILLIH
jgi:uncharacterized protein